MNPQENKPEAKEQELSHIEYLISDWDGTLVDSMPAYTDSFAKTLHLKFGIDKDQLKTYYKRAAGRALSHQIKEVVQSFAHVEVEDTRQLEEEFWQNLVGMKPEILHGTKEFLSKLKQKGLRIIIWSGTRTDVLGEKINLLSFSPLVDFYIGNVPGDENLVKGPGLFKLIAKKFSIPTDELARKSLVIGDGIGDIEAGKAVGAITALFVRTGINTDVRDLGANFVFDNLEALADKLKKPLTQS